MEIQDRLFYLLAYCGFLLIVMIATQLTLGKIYFTLTGINEARYWIVGGIIGWIIGQGINYYYNNN